MAKSEKANPVPENYVNLEESEHHPSSQAKRHGHRICETRVYS
jgi:hypothetical protein